jgi:hypothetical protein
MMNYNYDLKLNMKELITFLEEEIDFGDQLFSMLLTFSCLVKTDFNLMDKEFKRLGNLFLSNVIKDSDDLFVYKSFIRDGFSQLMLNNMEFSQSELFPDKDIQMINSILQVELLLDEKNFILLPNILVKCSDIQFAFK